MTGKGHTLTGFAIALYPASIVYEHGIICAFLAAIGCVLGTTAPDWMEIPLPVKNAEGKKVGYRRLIIHRTWTHVLLWWVIFAWVAYSVTVGDDLPFISQIDIPFKFEVYALLMGFSMGGVLHLLCDIPNKQKVPIFTPWDGFSLNFWKSQKNEWLVAALVLFVSLVLIQENYQLPYISEYLPFL